MFFNQRLAVQAIALRSTAGIPHARISAHEDVHFPFRGAGGYCTFSQLQFAQTQRHRKFVNECSAPPIREPLIAI